MPSSSFPMSPEKLLSLSLPVHSPPPHPSPPSNLHFSLLFSPTPPSLSLSLSDLSHRLLLLSTNLTPPLYASLRSAQSLHPDFSSFPAHLADLLRRPLSDPAFRLLLTLSETDDSASLSIVQLTPYKDIPHLLLPLTKASPTQLVEALADRIRSLASVHADNTRLQALADERQSNLQRLRQQIESVKKDNDESNQRAQNAERQIEEDATKISQMDDTLQALNQQVETLKRESAILRENVQTENQRAELSEKRVADMERAEAHREREAVERGRREGGRQLERFRRDFDTLNTRAENAEREREKLRQDVAKLTDDLRVEKARGRVKAQVINKQEERVGREEAKVARLERELRRARDRVKLLEVERQGLDEHVKGLEAKLEESKEVLRSDSRVIAYLNRELNEKSAREDAAANTGRNRLAVT